MLLRTIGYNKWHIGLRTMHDFGKAAVLVESKPVYTDDVPSDLFQASREHVSRVWVYVLFRENNSEALKVTACLDGEHAFQSQHLLFEYLQQHREKWLRTETVSFPREWTLPDPSNGVEDLFSGQSLLTPCPLPLQRS